MRFDSPRPSSRPASPFATDVQATVKWFNPVKGFGFVSPTDGSPDAFLHASALQAAGYDTVPDGATLTVDLAHGPKGAQVSLLHSVDLSTAVSSLGRGGGPGRGGFQRSEVGYRDAGRDAGPTEEITGTVKWFSPDKGFGFVAPEEGGKDVFVPMRAVERAGHSTLKEGQRVIVQVRRGQKGPEATEISLA